MTNGYDNPSFVGDTVFTIPERKNNNAELIDVEIKHPNYASTTVSQVHDDKSSKKNGKTTKHKERESWGKGIEFLLSCIAMSVGLGNIWRFPFIALENGGGAFVIPYIIVLLLVGKPVYFMEMVLGQFSSRGSVKVFDCVPAMRGIGVGQVVSITIVATYYSSLMALTLNFFESSFSSTLPWSSCKPEWGSCIPSGQNGVVNMTWNNSTKSSAELYFLKEVLKAKESINDGIGVPSWRLVIFLAISWTLVFLILIKGVKSSGKASYVLAIFPYFVLTILLTRALTLPGSMNGIIYFLSPQWDKIFDPKVWYAAVTQVFFSLSICFGNIIMYSSYNKFGHNVYRDANIVTTLDTFTSLLAGCCIFGILGHLAHELGVEDISKVTRSGAGLAFISYPDAIAKFKTLPQVFSVLFFLMLYLLGIGSNVAMMSCIMTVVRDRFKKIKNWQIALVIAIFGTGFGSIYMTPSGQSVLKLVDYYGASFVTFILAIAELYTFCFIYGVERLCNDVEFMLGFRPNWFWRICWKFVTPGLMTVILVYTLFNLEPLQDNGKDYPLTAHLIGMFISFLGLVQLPGFMVYAILKQKKNTLLERIKAAFEPTEKWGPIDPKLNLKYKEYVNKKN
ncbi:CLUMA_CG020393, isoform A [Clunio marinus]|uniref:Transporter n=1 Tax=Clunio marinus TaxID=568069 RepID=A0A1J1J6L0_9DIPT|nr:CLUMA_CG020393, isoform A [Clunio marinus]